MFQTTSQIMMIHSNDALINHWKSIVTINNSIVTKKVKNDKKAQLTRISLLFMGNDVLFE
jgi:hypothetical protein